MKDASVAALPLHRRVRHGLRHPHNWFQLVRFGLVGASGYAVNLAVFTIAVHPLDIGYRVAAVLAFLVSVTNNFWWNRHWTFDGRGGHAGFQAARFFLVSIVAFAFNYAILVALVELADVPKVAAQAIAIAAATPLNFLGQKLWSFRR
ncbi:GtrA family protein [Conexibacter woesei]|uniref:GtrA family protein n=1 Tax=Conexibacter woesei (strain DSM 14684 / CCUG 47730 / CIP 108061 / JCM 11494 / NBRC 100937 / ID131577) TaxID=469383 RepID=D3F3W2_CONWI|nr:GtrA family protein [Conexibacter woesei]ADB54337.1 GtrA family protein [Conexibacter woesei DSM 14684]